MNKARIYSQVNSILNELGEDYISKLPEKIYNAVTRNKDDEYSPEYDISKSLTEQEVYKETIAIICYFHKSFWCKDEKEKKFIDRILGMNKNEKEDDEILFPTSSSGDDRNQSLKEPVYNDGKNIPIKKKKDIIDRFLESYLEL